VELHGPHRRLLRHHLLHHGHDVSKHDMRSIFVTYT
jgi:hypothetical protein